MTERLELQKKLTQTHKYFLFIYLLGIIFVKELEINSLSFIHNLLLAIIFESIIIQFVSSLLYSF